MRIFVCFFCVCFSIFSNYAAAFQVSFSPQGVIKKPKQVRAVFSEDMVPFGNPKAKSPFVVKCSAKGKGYWETTKEWILDFEDEFAAGQSCRFKLRQGIKSLSGASVIGESQFEFNSDGPALIRSFPGEGSEVMEDQTFLLMFDAPVVPESVEANLQFEVEDSLEKIRGKVIPGSKLSKSVLKVLGAVEPSRVVSVSPNRRFSAANRLNVRILPGLRALNGFAAKAESKFSYRIRKPFFAKFQCERENDKSGCNPIASSLRMEFSEDVPVEMAEKVRIRTLDGKQEWAPILNKQAEKAVSRFSFAGMFPPNQTFKVFVPADLRDFTGRKLTNEKKFPLEIKTGSYPPLIKFAADFGMLEASHPVLPVTVRNVEAKLDVRKFPGKRLELGPGQDLAIIEWMKRRKVWDGAVMKQEYGDGDSRAYSVFSPQETASVEKFELPKPNGAEPFEVVGIPLKGKGFHVVEIESPALGGSLIQDRQPMKVTAKALVTDLSVHCKLGGETVLCWVTKLSNANPVSGAKISIYGDSENLLISGKTDNQGIYLKELEPKEREIVRGARYVFATKDDDFTFLSTYWNSGIESWRFNVSSFFRESEKFARTVLDRTLFRAGETVHMKHFVREPVLRGLRVGSTAVDTVVVRGPTGKVFALPLKLDSLGTATNDWQIPKDSILGTYRIYLTVLKDSKVDLSGAASNGEDEFDGARIFGAETYEAAAFRVEEFRLPVLKGKLEWSGSDAALSADLQVQYLSGGAAVELPVLMRGSWTKLPGKIFPNWENFIFSNGGLFEGKEDEEVEENYYCDEEGGCFSDVSGERGPSNENILQMLPVKQLTLDKNGGARVPINSAPKWSSGATLRLEAEYRDPNGEVVTTSRSKEVFPRNRLIGIGLEQWFVSQGKVKFKVAVTDDSGSPVSNEAVSVTWWKRSLFGHRKRLMGGLYSYEYKSEVKKLGKACEGTTDASGVLRCNVNSIDKGELILVAEMKNGGVMARHPIWVGDKDSVFSQRNGDRIDLIPEKKRYEPGETARIQVRMPFPKATALVTLEREGVRKAFVKEIAIEAPYIEVPIDGSYSPNFFLSVFVVRGRADSFKPSALVDLGKPAFKMGLTEIDVGWKAHELKVAVTPEKKEFRVKTKAKAIVKVTRALDGRPAVDAEVAIAVVDEALLELKGNNTWKLLEAMMVKRALQVETSTSQGMIIGKRHFGLKAIPTGGGGGRMTSRELFDTLVYWNPRVKVDGQGQATLDFPLNDSLSSFRIVAVASEGADKFGTGSDSVSSFQELMSFSGVSPVAREGDLTHPELTVRNATREDMEVKVEGSVGGNNLGAKSIRLKGGESSVLKWEYRVPEGVKDLRYQFFLRSENFSDSLIAKQEVLPRLKESVIQATLERIEQTKSIPVRLPEDAVRDGTLSVRLDRSLVAGLGSVKEYLGQYPYSCLEQQVSKLIATKSSKDWESFIGGISSYQDSGGLFKYFPNLSSGSVVLTNYVLKITHEAGLLLPKDVERSAIDGIVDVLNGRYSPFESYWNPRYLNWLRIGLIETMTRYGKFNLGWLSTVDKEPAKWPNSALIDWWQIHVRRADIPGGSAVAKKASDLLRSRLSWRGTTVAFSNETEDGYWIFMDSGDVIANRLLLAANDQPEWRNDIGRLARGVLLRLKRGQWDLTTANAWGTLSMEKFAKLHESELVDGKTELDWNGRTEKIEWSKAESSSRIDLPWSKVDEKLKIDHRGTGRPWAFIYAKAALRLKTPIYKGYKLKRTVEPVVRAKKDLWTRGDVYRVRIEINAPSDMSWVVVDDPVPSGAKILGSGLGGDSALLSQGSADPDYMWWGTVDERKFDSFRRYFEFLPQGKHTIEYTVRLSAFGMFHMPNSRIEAMYAPEMYAEVPNEAMDVSP